MGWRGFVGLVRCVLVEYVGQGFAVFPLSKNSKVPQKGSNGYKDATKSLEEFENLSDLKSISAIPSSSAGQTSLAGTNTSG